MNPTQIHETYKQVLALLSEAKLSAAISKCNLLVNELQEGKYNDRFEEIQQNYRFMLQYYIKGVEDPQRKLVHNRLISKLFVLSCELREELLFRNSSNFEYQQKRYFPHLRRFTTIDKLKSALQYHHTLELKDIEADINQKNYEELIHDVFSIFWLSTTFGDAELSLFNTLLENDYSGRLEKNLAITALTLNLWRMFDEDKLLLLLDACNHVNVEVKQRSLVGLCFVLARYNRFIPFFPQVRNRLVLLADDHLTSINFRNIIVQIIGTVETDKITKKLRDEILPEIMKVSPLIKDKMDADNMLSSEEWGEANPEWQEILEKSGVQDKIQEFTDLQMEGADVYMGTFAMLKNFNFFNDISNWFLPFDPGHSKVKELFGSSESSLLSAFVAHNALCNSDKYSFCLSVLQMPEMQRNLLKNNFKQETEQLAEMAKDEAILAPEVHAKNISKQYIQDLFRFFKLHPNCRDFSDMFASALFMHRSFLFGILSSGTELKSYVAEYYFSKSQYREAIELFNEVIEENEPTAEIFQKIGYCYQQISDLNKALEAYLRADMIQPDNLWTTKKIALCFKLTGNFKQALDYYKHADFLRPEQRKIKMQIANCYRELGNYNQAIEIYSELELDDETDLKALRAIALCALIMGNKAQARYYSQRIIENNALVTDYLMAAFVEALDDKIVDAVNLLTIALTKEKNDIYKVEKLMFHELEKLKEVGITVPDINLLWDGTVQNLI